MKKRFRDLIDEVMYEDLLKTYFGNSIEITEADRYLWLEYPHYYLDFYLFSYATSFVSSIQLAGDIHKEGDPAVERFMDILSAGTSDYPVDVLQKAGLDLYSSVPYESLAEILNDLMDQMEELLQF